MKKLTKNFGIVRFEGISIFSSTKRLDLSLSTLDEIKS